jgi:hypothetical protein
MHEPGDQARACSSGPRWLLLAFVIGMLGSSVAHAEETSPSDPHAVQPERPTVATHAHTVAPGWVEIEAGVERDRFADDSRAFSTPTVMKIGIERRAQLNLSGAWQRLEADGATSSGAGDCSIGIKWRLADGAPIAGDFAVLPALKLPTGSSERGTGTGTTDASLLLISSHDVGAISVDANLGYTRRGGDGSRTPRDATLWTVSAGFPAIGRLGGTAELYGFPGTSGPAGSTPLVAVLAGPTMNVRTWLAVDAGVIVPVEGPQPHAFYAGMVWNIGRL